jgi:RNA polymerase sigma factor (sigma-70 family)
MAAKRRRAKVLSSAGIDGEPGQPVVRRLGPGVPMGRAERCIVRRPTQVRDMKVPLDFESFCHEVYLPLVRMLTLYCGDPEVARDIAQESMIKVSSRWRAVQQMDNPRGWTWKVSINLANSHFRRKKLEQRSFRVLGNSGHLMVHQDRDLSLEISIRSMLQALPPRQREALVLRYYQDMPVAEVSDVMGCSSSTVKKLAARGLAAMRNTMGAVESADGARDER